MRGISPLLKDRLVEDLENTGKGDLFVISAGRRVIVPGAAGYFIIPAGDARAEDKVAITRDAQLLDRVDELVARQEFLSAWHSKSWP